MRCYVGYTRREVRTGVEDDMWYCRQSKTMAIFGKVQPIESKCELDIVITEHIIPKIKMYNGLSNHFTRTLFVRQA